MVPLRPRSRLSLLAGFLSVAAGLAWLMFGLGGNRTGLRLLPDADGSTVESLADHDGRLTLAEAIAKPADAWKTWDGRGYLRVARHEVMWVRVVLKNRETQPMRGALTDLQYFTDRLTGWVQAGDEAGSGPDAWRRFESGEALPGRAKPLWGRLAAFPVDVPAGGARTIYLRAEDVLTVYLQVRWWPRLEDFFAAEMRDVLVQSVCYGGLAALLLYNLVLWVRLRFPDTGCYVLYAGALALFNFTSNGGCALLGFGLGSPGKEVVITGSLAASGFFMVQFARTFLGTATVLPRVDRALGVLRLTLGALALCSLLMLAGSGLRWLLLAVVFSALTHATLLVVAVITWRAGVQHARFFVAAFGVLFVGAVPAVIEWLRGDLHASAAMGLLGGATLEMLLLSFAVADRFSRMQRERFEAQQRLVEETEQRRVIQEAYADELELEVTERTRDLAASNTDKDRMIAVLGHDLRGPLTGLTQSAERLAARLPPGESERFAVEAGRTGRMLLLLIEDLVMWARLRAGSLHVTQHAVQNWVAPALAIHRGLAERAGVELVAHVPANLQAKTDVVLVQALVRNLVSNGIKYARHRVEIVAEATAGGVRLSVQDDGPGLPPEIVAWLNADGAAATPTGGGLGLRFCVEISRALGARLESTSEPGGGARLAVWFKIPVGEPAAP